jgi:transcriptional regulator with XRE-family HTH domain
LGLLLSPKPVYLYSHALHRVNQIVLNRSKMPDIPLQLCRAARGILGWSQADLANKSGVARSAIAGFESGNSVPTPRTFRDIAAAFEAAGVVFVDPVEGVHQGAVGLKWGAEIPQREPKTEGRAGPDALGASQAAPWDEGIDALREEAAQFADPEIEAMRTYWRQHPSEWAGLSRAGQRVLLLEMRLNNLGAGAI